MRTEDNESSDIQYRVATDFESDDIDFCDGTPSASVEDFSLMSNIVELRTEISTLVRSRNLFEKLLTNLNKCMSTVVKRIGAGDMAYWTGPVASDAHRVLSECDPRGHVMVMYRSTSGSVVFDYNRSCAEGEVKVAVGIWPSQPVNSALHPGGSQKLFLCCRDGAVPGRVSTVEEETSIIDKLRKPNQVVYLGVKNKTASSYLEIGDCSVESGDDNFAIARFRVGRGTNITIRSWWF